jgi:hypothetical protein
MNSSPRRENKLLYVDFKPLNLFDVTQTGAAVFKFKEVAFKRGPDCSFCLKWLWIIFKLSIRFRYGSWPENKVATPSRKVLS